MSDNIPFEDILPMITGAVSELAAKRDFTRIYEAAERHGAYEWLYRQNHDDGLTQYVGIAGWQSTFHEITLESFAGLANIAGYTRQPTMRIETSAALTHNLYDQLSELWTAAHTRTDRLYQHAISTEASGESAVETPFVVRRSRQSQAL